MLSSVNQDARNVDGPDQEIQESDPDLQMWFSSLYDIVFMLYMFTFLIQNLL
jgi:hypothetical protein